MSGEPGILKYRCPNETARQAFKDCLAEKGLPGVQSSGGLAGNCSGAGAAGLAVE